MIVLDGKSEIEANRELEKRKKRKKASAQRRQKKRKARERKGLITPSNVQVQDLNDLIVETVNADENGINSPDKEQSRDENVQPGDETSLANHNSNETVTMKSESVNA